MVTELGALQFEGTVCHGREAMVAELEAAGHISSAGTNQRKNSCVQLTFFLSFSLGLKLRKWGSPHLGRIFPPQLIYLNKSLEVMSRELSSI